MMDIRKKLMAGEKIPQCDVCNESILSRTAIIDNGLQDFYLKNI